MRMSSDRGLWLAQRLEHATLDYYRAHGGRFEAMVIRSIWPRRCKWALPLSSFLFDRASAAESPEDNPRWPTTYRSWAWSTLGCTVQAYGEWRNRKPMKEKN